MKITAVGVGSAFAGEDKYQTMFLVERNKRKLLVDCGSDARFALKELGITNQNVGGQIDGVYVSHLHADHIGGLEWLGFCTYFNPDAVRPKLYMNTDLMTEAWNQTLRGGMQSVEGKDCNLTDYFDCHRIPDGGKFEWEGIKFQTVQMVHIVSGFSFRNSYGLLVTDSYKVEPDERGATLRHDVVFLTTDTQFAPNQLNHFYDRATIIVHDCETLPYRSGVHAHYDELVELPEKVKKKMWLAHYSTADGRTPEKDGFKGFLRKGDVIVDRGDS